MGLLDLEENRPWASFFLQYLWEFGLGMWIAESCMMSDGKEQRIMDIKSYRWWWLVLGAIGGMSLSALMAWNGGVLKLYNEIPSLIGYLSIALLIYKTGVKMANQFLEWTNSFSYELYLVHSIVFVLVGYLLTSSIAVFPISALLTIKFVIAYIVAYVYNWFLNNKFAKWQNVFHRITK